MDCGLTGLTCNDPSLTEARFRDECDLSVIIKRFLKTGELPQMRDKSVIQSDEGMPTDYFEMMSRVAEARSRFDALPLETRNRFNNDPEAFYTALAEDIKNHPAEAPKTVEEPKKAENAVDPQTAEEPKKD